MNLTDTQHALGEHSTHCPFYSSTFGGLSVHFQFGVIINGAAMVLFFFFAMHAACGILVP